MFLLYFVPWNNRRMMNNLIVEVFIGIRTNETFCYLCIYHLIIYVVSYLFPYNLICFNIRWFLRRTLAKFTILRLKLPHSNSWVSICEFMMLRNHHVISWITMVFKISKFTVCIIYLFELECVPNNFSFCSFFAFNDFG